MARRSTGRRPLACISLVVLCLVLAMTGGAFASTITPLAVSGSTWYVSTWPAAVAFRVSRPTIALTVVVPAGAAAPAGGTVTVSGHPVPATVLRTQAVPGAMAFTVGENSLTLPASGKASITLAGAGGLALPTQSFSFTVAAGAPPGVPAPTAQESAYIAELNAFRAQVGAPPVVVSAALTAAAAAHAAFVNEQAARYRTGVSVHDEPLAWSALPGWTGLYAGDRDLAFGAATGGGVEVMSSGNPDPVAFLVAETVFHRDLLLDPGALAAGAADVGGQFVLDLSDWGGATGVAPTVWPPNRSTAEPLTFGGEWPSPLQPFAGLHFPVGTPLSWDDYAAPPGTRIVSGTFTVASQPGGRPVAGAVLTPQLWEPFSGPGVYMGTSLAFIPRSPLAAHTTYVASVAAVEALPGGGARQLSRTWSFTTGDGSVLPPGGVAQAASQPAVVAATVPKDPWMAIPATVRARLAALAVAAKGRAPAYTDLYLAPWAAPAVDGLSAAGVVHGIGADMFDPSAPLTLGQLAAALTAYVPPSPPLRAALANASALPAWAIAPAEEAVAAGWLDAPGGVLAVDAWATRATAVEAITRLLGWSGAAAAYAAAGGRWPAGIQGDAGMSGEPETDLRWAAHVGLINGVAGQAAGAQALTRAQLAEVLWRVIEKAGS